MLYIQAAAARLRPLFLKSLLLVQFPNNSLCINFRHPTMKGKVMDNLTEQAEVILCNLIALSDTERVEFAIPHG